MDILVTRRGLVLGTVAAVGGIRPGFCAERSGPMKLIVPTPPGSASDALARTLAVSLARSSARAVVVDNIAGAGSLVGTVQLSRSPKDGLTLGVVSSNHTLMQWLFTGAGFDAVADFTPITMVGNVPMMLVASNASSIRGMAELVGKARSHPDSLAEGVATGSIYQMASEVFKDEAGITTNRIFYKGSAQIINDLLAGILDVAFVSVQGASPFVAAGRLKALAVNTPARVDVVPAVPTLVESGYPRFNVEAWVAIVGPAGLSAQSVALRQKEIDEALRDPVTAEALKQQGIVQRRMSPESMRQFFQQELERNREVIQRVGIKVN